MRITFIAHFAGSPSYGMVFGHYQLAREWLASGHDVTIVAASFAHTRHRQPTVRGRITEESIDGIRYLWIRTPSYDPAGRFGRVANILSFALQARFLPLPIARQDMVIASSHHPFGFLAAERIARRDNARLVFEVRDLWPLTLIELGGVSRANPLIAAMQWAEDRAYARADKVVSVLPQSLGYMVSRGMDPAKFACIPNGIDPGLPSEPLPESHVRALQQLRASSPFLLGYAGRVGLANALLPVVEALALDKTTNAALAILGDGPDRRTLEGHADALGLHSRVVVLPPVAKSQVADFLGRVDAAYLGLAPSPLFRHGVSPTKLNDYLLAAKPVIVAVDAPCDPLGTIDCGFQASPSDPPAIAEAIRRLASLDHSERSRMGSEGRRWVLAERSYSVLARRFMEHVLA